MTAFYIVISIAIITAIITIITFNRYASKNPEDEDKKH
ncbi:MAG: hypothetical protein UT16_C0001G0017 [Candidatus Azambacteria bacterium GW2011_GWA2_39_10]|uniref:Uncharacterized protein n=1 Tax=Candidatus Azambacteria bacterium GW2011_GWA2_39_10 TaxID=1618611 RepID=A0A0G0PUE7_9BACT|nr:MAG: hypothetical protein UT16_C0001G0017 [Candidatus Azambacteria bacterium GW2011_GWA2_39_10]